jgi:hypothetical protein
MDQPKKWEYLQLKGREMEAHIYDPLYVDFSQEGDRLGEGEDMQMKIYDLRFLLECGSHGNSQRHQARRPSVSSLPNTICVSSIPRGEMDGEAKLKLLVNACPPNTTLILG